MNYASNDVSIWGNAGDGTFSPQVRYGAGKSSLDLSFADFDGDGLDDLLTYDTTFPPLSTGLLLFRGTGRSQGPRSARAPEPLGQATRSFDR